MVIIINFLVFAQCFQVWGHFSSQNFRGPAALEPFPPPPPKKKKKKKKTGTKAVQRGSNFFLSLLQNDLHTKGNYISNFKGLAVLEPLHNRGKGVKFHFFAAKSSVYQGIFYINKNYILWEN